MNKGGSLGCGIVVRKEILRLPEMPQFQKLSYFCSRFQVSLAKRYLESRQPKVVSGYGRRFRLLRLGMQKLK